jgi:DNA polymerase-3 subunit epsilon
MAKFCFIDCETTGVDPQKNGLLQVSGIIRTEKRTDCPVTEERFTLRIQPFATDVVEKEALEANKLDPKEGLLPAEAHIELLKILSRHVDKYNKRDKFFFVGYNAHFDADFLRAFFGKCKDKYFGSWFWNPPLDVMGLALAHLLNSRFAMENFKLGTVARALDIEFDLLKAHSAEYDIQKTAEIFDLVVNGKI